MPGQLMKSYVQRRTTAPSGEARKGTIVRLINDLFDENPVRAIRDFRHARETQKISTSSKES